MECRVYDATVDSSTFGWEKSGEPFVNNLKLVIQDGFLTNLRGRVFQDIQDENEQDEKMRRYIYYFLVENLDGRQADRLKASGKITPVIFPINTRTKDEVKRVLNRNPNVIKYEEEITVA